MLELVVNDQNNDMEHAAQNGGVIRVEQGEEIKVDEEGPQAQESDNSSSSEQSDLDEAAPVKVHWSNIEEANQNGASRKVLTRQRKTHKIFNLP